MLITWNRTTRAIFVWSLDPVPASIAVTAQTPRIVQTTLISCSTTETHHHARRTACLTECSRVIDSHLRCFLSAVQLDPGERCLLYAEAPHVAHRFLSRITTKYEQLWLREHDTVAVSASRRRTNHWNNHPLGLLLAISHVE